MSDACTWKQNPRKVYVICRTSLSAVPWPTSFFVTSTCLCRYVNKDRNTPQAFSHFTYQMSGCKLLICDIQGVWGVWSVAERVHMMPYLWFIYTHVHTGYMQKCPCVAGEPTGHFSYLYDTYRVRVHVAF